MGVRHVAPGPLGLLPQEVGGRAGPPPSRRGVAKECLAYCSHSKAPNDYLRHLFCLQAFNPIKDCFRSHLDLHPNIFGDR